MLNIIVNLIVNLNVNLIVNLIVGLIVNLSVDIQYIYYIPYARHYNPLLIRNRSWIVTIHKARILKNKPLEKMFLDFKKWIESKQTAGYNGVRTVDKSNRK